MERPLSRRREKLLERRSRIYPGFVARPASPRRTCSITAAAARGRASTSSPRTTASRWLISSPTTSKHNEANGENNNDGHDDNRSWNCGVEGPTDDESILDLRDRLRRNLMATLLLSQGTPMLLMGDEMGRTQHGNNNAYCQDNEISWMDWEQGNERNLAFNDFTTRLIELRRRHPILRQSQFLHGTRTLSRWDGRYHLAAARR